MADIGIMGGTFDPIHNGHLLLGEQAYREYGLAEVWFMPSGDPPHKTDHRVTPATDRCADGTAGDSGPAVFQIFGF